MSGRSTGSCSDLLRLAVDVCRTGMLAVDEAGTILLANREVERLFGYKRAELLHRHIDTILPAGLRGLPVGRYDSQEDALVSRDYGSAAQVSHATAMRKDGSDLPVEIELTAIPGDDGAALLVSLIDDTDRRLTEEHLRQSQKMEALSTLAGGIAHDFNNILLSIMGHAELAHAAVTDAQVRADLGHIVSAAERGQQLVQQILTFSRQRKVARVPLRPEQVCAAALRQLRSALPSSIEVREAFDPATPKVLSDALQLHQVLTSLTSNAIDAMPRGGVVEVALAPFIVDDAFAASRPRLLPGLHAHLSVVDTGHGMGSDVLKRVFEPFFTTRQRAQSTGLGLSVVHGILQGHGGAIEIRSRPGEGTRVDVYLPAHVAQVRSMLPPAHVVEPTRCPHILLVDDEPPLALMLSRQLTAAGYRVTVHTSSLAALACFEAAPHDFDLLITDNTMPKLSGLGLSAAVLRKRPKLPILLISGLAETFDAAELEAWGITRLLAKPHTSRQLADTISELVGHAPPSALEACQG